MTHAGIATLLTLVFVAGCSVAYATHPPVPATPAEQVPAPPKSAVTLIWQPGHFDWNGAAYSWVRGQWVPRAGHGTLWQDGYWTVTGGQSVWVAAHWI